MFRLVVFTFFFVQCTFAVCQDKKVTIDGVIVISDDEDETPVAGTIRWNGTDFQGYDGAQWRTFSYTFADEESMNVSVSDNFAGDGPLLNYSTNNEMSLPGVGRVGGRYRAEVVDNSNNITLHFNGSQGRLDAKAVTFPFDYIVRNIGIGTQADSQTAPSGINSYIFAGIQVHVHPDFNSINSSHFVVGHRGNTSFTVEGKNTVNGSSSVNDAGENVVPAGRADLRIEGRADNTIRWYYQEPNTDIGGAADQWIPYRGTGVFPGTAPVFGDTVYIGPITYAYGNANIPFVGTIDSIELVGE